MVHTRKPPYKQLLVGMVAGGMSSLGAGVIIMPPLSLMWPLAPTIHPASSRLQQWGWVPLLVVVNRLWGWWAVRGDVVRLQGPKTNPSHPILTWRRGWVHVASCHCSKKVDKLTKSKMMLVFKKEA